MLHCTFVPLTDCKFMGKYEMMVIVVDALKAPVFEALRFMC